MAKIVLPNVASSYNLSTINNNFQKIATELNDKVLYRDSPPLEPNHMENDLDMNSNRIYNLPKPVTGTEPVRLMDIGDIGGGGGGNTTASNIGTGEGKVFSNKVGDDLRFKSLKAGSNVTITNGAGEITISSTGGSSGGGSPTGPAGGVLSGSYPNPGFAQDMATQVELDVGLAGKANVVHKHTLSDLLQSGATEAGQVPTWNGSEWVPALPPTGADCDCDNSSDPFPADDKIRIAVIGDSISAEQPTLAAAWPSHLQRTLNGSGTKVEVIDLAINGWTFNLARTSGVFGAATMLQKCIEMKPHIVLVALGFNDLVGNIEGRTLGQVQTDASTFFSELRAALPDAKIAYVRQVAYDKDLGTPSTLVNKQVIPSLWQTKSSGILAGSYCIEALEDAISSSNRTNITNHDTFTTFVSGLSTVDTTIELDMFRCARLGLTGYDGLHFTESGHILFAAQIRNFFRINGVLAAAVPGLSDQAYPPYRDSFRGATSVFDSMLSVSGSGYVEKVPPTAAGNHVAFQTGIIQRFPVNVWFLPSKGAIKWNRTTLPTNETFLWELRGSHPLQSIEVSINGGAFGNVGTTDMRGDYINAGTLIILPPSSYVYRYKVGNEIYGPVTITLTAPPASSTTWSAVTSKPFETIGSGLTVSSGALQLETPRGGAAYGRAAATAAIVGWTTVYWGAGSATSWGSGVTTSSGDRITVATAGVYRCAASVLFSRAGSAGYPVNTIAMLGLRIYRGGSPIMRQSGETFYAPAAGYASTLAVDAVFTLNAGDQIVVEGLSTSNLGAFLGENEHGEASNFSVQRI